MTDALIEVVIDNWEPRIVGAGVDLYEYRRVAASVETWAEWLTVWETHGDQRAAKAQELEEAGRAETAGDMWRRAMLAYHFGKFVWTLDMGLHDRVADKAAQALRSAHRLLDPKAQWLEIPFDGAIMTAILRRPALAERPPLVVLIPGLDSTKEEFFGAESIFHERGMATLTLEGPGQGDTGRRLKIRPDFDVPFGVALDYLASRDDLDLGRVGTIGFSLGGYYAPRVAAFEPRVKAAVGISGAYRFSDHWDELPVMTRATFRQHSNAPSDAEAKRIAATLSLEAVAGKISQPLLIITGDLDRLVPWRESKRIADEAPNSTWKLYHGGNHVVNNRYYESKAFAADWLREQLAFTPMASTYHVAPQFP